MWTSAPLRYSSPGELERICASVSPSVNGEPRVLTSEGTWGIHPDVWRLDSWAHTDQHRRGRCSLGSSGAQPELGEPGRAHVPALPHWPCDRRLGVSPSVPSIYVHTLCRELELDVCSAGGLSATVTHWGLPAPLPRLDIYFERPGGARLPAGPGSAGLIPGCPVQPG